MTYMTIHVACCAMSNIQVERIETRDSVTEHSAIPGAEQTSQLGRHICKMEYSIPVSRHDAASHPKIAETATA